MRIVERCKKVPGGLMLVMVFIGAVMNTFFPTWLQIGDPFTVTSTKSGLMPMVGLMLFFTGTQMKGETIKKVARRGGMLFLFKLGLFLIFGYTVWNLLGTGSFLGISSLAWITAFMSCNSALYLSIVQQLGDDVDQANFGLLTLVGMPNVALLLFNQSSSIMEIVADVAAMSLPFLLGMIITYLDSSFQRMFEKGTQCIIPIAGFEFGTNIHLLTMFQSGFAGIVLCVVTLCLSLIPTLIFDCKVLKQPGYAAIASCGLSGVSLSLPYLASQIVSEFEPIVEVVTGQCAVALLLTTFLLPFIAKGWMKLKRVDC